jgi:hypothetical protein
MSGGTLSSGSMSFTNRSSSQTFNSDSINIATSDLSSGNLVDFRGGASAADVDLYYPNDSTFNNGILNLILSVNFNDGSTNASSSLTFKFANKFYHGVHADDTLTATYLTNSGSGSIFGLDTSDNALSSISVNRQFTTTGQQHYHLAFPYRYTVTGNLNFQIDGGPPTSLIQVTDNLTVTNLYGYQERYYHYRTPGDGYTNAGPFTITITV